MNCPNCNTPLGENDVFCLNCGQKVVSEQAPQEVPVQAPQYAAPVSNEPAATYNEPNQYAAPNNVYTDPASYAAPNAYNAPNQYAAPNAYNNPNPQYAAPMAEPKKKTSPVEIIQNLFTTVTTNIMNFVNSNENIRKILFKEDGKINVIVPAAAGGVVVVLVALIIILSAGGGAKSVAEDYLEATVETDIYTMLENEVIDNKTIKGMLKDLAEEEELTEKELYEKIAKNIDKSDADFTNYKGFAKYLSGTYEEDRKEWLEDVYGDDYKIKVEVESPEKCTKSRSEDHRDELEEIIEFVESNTDTRLNFDSDDAKKFVEVDYTIVIEGSEDREKDRGTLVLAKIKGDWKVLDFSVEYLSAFVDID